MLNPLAIYPVPKKGRGAQADKNPDKSSDKDKRKEGELSEAVPTITLKSVPRNSEHIKRAETKNFFDKLDYVLIFVIGLCVILKYFFFIFNFETLYLILNVVLVLSIIYCVIKSLYNFIRHLKN